MRVEDTLAQSDDEEVLLNLQFLKKELETFVEGFDFKGFYFPVKYALNFQPLMKNMKEKYFIQLPWRNTSWLSKIGILDNIWVYLRLPGLDLKI